MADFDSDFPVSNSFDNDFPQQAHHGTGSFAGDIADTFFTESAPGRVMNAFGQGVKQSWGHGFVELGQETDAWMTKHGVYNDYQKGNENLIKGLNETFLRPTIYGALATGRVLGAGFEGLFKASEQTSKELTDDSKSPGNPDLPWYAPTNLTHTVTRPLEGATGELLADLNAGAGLESFAQATSLSRAKAITGEGEAGFFNTREPKPEILTERVNAAKEAGVSPKPVQPVDFNIDTIARQINPDVFNEADRLKDIQENLRLSKAYLTGQLGRSYKEDLEIKRKLEAIPLELQGVDEKLRDLIPAQVTARQTTEEMLNSQSKEGSAFRDYIQAQRLEAAIKAEDIAPEIADAKAHAELLVPGPKERAETLKKQAKEKEKLQKLEETVTNPEGSTVPEGQVAVESSQVLQAIPGTGETKVRGLAANIEASAVERGLAESFGDLPTYQVVKDSDQAAKIADLMNTDLEKAKRIALGDEAAPQGIIPEFVLDAVERHAAATGDGQLILDLGTKSKLLEQGTTMGQRIHALGARQAMEDNPVKMIQSAAAARRETIKKTADTIKQSIDESIDKFKSDWDAFVKSIECDY